MRQFARRIRVADDGRLEIVDPDFDDLDLLWAVDPTYEVASAQLYGFTTPRFQRARATGSGLSRTQLAAAASGVLDEALAVGALLVKGGQQAAPIGDGEANLIQVAIEVVRRRLRHCDLCALDCGVGRSAGQFGRCGLGTEAVVAEHFVHIGEEAPINPSLVVSLAGCGLRCQFCQQWPLLNVAGTVGRALDASLWAELDFDGARSLSFVGGNPDESLYAVLRFLEAAPAEFKLPIVWNNHGYVTPEHVALLGSFVDVWLPDLKYGRDECARRWSRVPAYVSVVKAAILAMVASGVPVLVRVLVLPGHVDCCHLPAIEWLAGLDAMDLWLSVRGQYFPDGALAGDGAQDAHMCGRPALADVQLVRERARALASENATH